MNKELENSAVQLEDDLEFTDIAKRKAIIIAAFELIKELHGENLISDNEYKIVKDKYHMNIA